MTEWKRILLSCSDGSVVPVQVVNAIVHQEVGVLGNESFYIVQIKAGDLTHNERIAGNDDDWCLLSWIGDDVDATFRGTVRGPDRSVYGEALFGRIQHHRSIGTFAHYHPLNQTAH